MASVGGEGTGPAGRVIDRPWVVIALKRSLLPRVREDDPAA
jgi:hypothetical protein